MEIQKYLGVILSCSSLDSVGVLLICARLYCGVLQWVLTFYLGDAEVLAWVPPRFR